MKKMFLLFWTAMIFLFVLCLSQPVHAEESAATLSAKLIGDQLYEQSRYTEAIDAYKQAIRINPDDADAYRELGRIYSVLKRYQEDIDALKQVIRIKPNDEEAYFSLGLAYEGLPGCHQEAIDAWKQAIRIKPDFADAHFLLGLLYGECGNKASALTQYKILTDLKSPLADSLSDQISKGETQEKEQETKTEGIKIVDTKSDKDLMPPQAQNIISEQLPETSSSLPAELTGDQLYEQGLALCSQGKYQESIYCLEEAVKRKSNFWEAYYQLSDCYNKTEQFGHAQSELVFIAYLCQDKNIKDKASKLSGEIGQRASETSKKKAEEKYKKFSEEWDKRWNERMELVRQERERVRLAQIEAERQMREEMSNYLATLSEEKRSLFTEIAKYFKGDELENTYNLAQKYNSISEEELRASLARVETPTNTVAYQQGEEEQQEKEKQEKEKKQSEEDYQAKIEKIKQDIVYGNTEEARMELRELEKSHVRDEELQNAQQELYWAEAKQRDKQRDEGELRSLKQEINYGNPIEIQQKLDRLKNSSYVNSNEVREIQQKLNWEESKYYQEQENQQQSSFQAQQLSQKQQDVSRQLKSIDSQIRFIPRNGVLSEKEIESMKWQNTDLGYKLDKIKQQKEEVDRGAIFLNPSFNSLQIEQEKRQQDSQIQRLKQEIQIQDYQLQKNQQMDQQNYQQQSGYKQQQDVYDRYNQQQNGYNQRQ